MADRTFSSRFPLYKIKKKSLFERKKNARAAGRGEKGISRRGK